MRSRAACHALTAAINANRHQILAMYGAGLTIKEITIRFRTFLTLNGVENFTETSLSNTIGRLIAFSKRDEGAALATFSEIARLKEELARAQASSVNDVNRKLEGVLDPARA